MIDRDYRLSITRQASLLNIGRARVYYLTCPNRSARPIWRSCADSTNCTWNTHSWGRRMLRDQLAWQGIHAGQRHVRTLMLRIGIEALAPQPGTSQRAPGHKVYP